MSENQKSEKICKCGHKRHPDHDNKKQLFGITYTTGTKCNGHKTYGNISTPCCCTVFLDRRFPSKYDKAMMITCFVTMGLTVLMFGIIISVMNIGLSCHTDKCNQLLDKPIWSIRDIANILVPMFLVFGLWTATWLSPSDYFRNKKRKIEPVEDEKNEQE